jgi:shikimate dehydrogenase
VTARIALLGHPLHQSLSPLMQGAAMRAAGIEGSYELLDVAPEDFARSLERVRNGEFIGCNVTMPYKESVVSLLDALDGDAARILAVNTVTRDGHRLVGHNTDSYGVLKAIERLMNGVPPAEADVVLLGAGGAGRATAYSLVRMGFRRIVLFNRNRERAERLRADFLDIAQNTVLEAQTLEPTALAGALRGAGLLVNATSVGFNSDVSPVPADLLPSGIRVFDVIYSPLETRLLRDARAAGAVALTNGIPMVIHQGARAFELWFGRRASIEVMTHALADARPASAATAPSTAD